MGSYENIIKIEELRKKMEEGDVFSAQKILDTMELKKIKSTSDLGIMAEVYMENERYEEAAQLYLKIYDKLKTRKALYNLVEVSIKRNNSEDAEYFLSEYRKMAPNDFYNLVFRYRINKVKGETFEVLIDTLVALKKIEYTEQWAYELAKTYYKAGMEEECIRECSDIILWFGEGTYVEKAKILRSYYSGETDKDKILEEIKRRAEEESTKAEASYNESNYFEEASEGKEDDIPENSNDNKESITEEISFGTQLEDSIEEIYSASDFMLEEETADFENSLKKDIQNMLLSPDMEESAVEEAAPATEEYIGSDIVSKENAEQEVEDTIYRLLQEVEMDEEDRKFNQLAAEMGFHPEEVFGNFIHVKSIKKQMVKSLEIIMEENSKPVQIIITGTEGSGKTTLAKDIALCLNQIGRLKSSKVAKIKAEKLNTIDILSKKETLKDCCVVVENASELKRQTIEGILDLVSLLQGNIAVVFEEDKKNINKLFREYPKLMDLFKNRIHLPQYTLEELIGFGKACLKQKEYELNPKAEIKLKSRIAQLENEPEQYKHLERVNQLMTSVMDAADIRTGRELSNLASQSRLKDFEAATILPEDVV